MKDTDKATFSKVQVSVYLTLVRCDKKNLTWN